MHANRMTVMALAGVVLGSLSATAMAQDAVRVRGTIEGMEGSTYVVKARNGTELKVALADNPQIAGVAFRHQAGLVRGRHGDAAS